MRPEIKICGLTLPEDAALAADAGASYLGVVFAESRRRVDAGRARHVLDAATRESVRRVGVFGEANADEILRAADRARLDVLQLHAIANAPGVDYLRSRFDGAIWGVVRVRVERIVRSEYSAWEHADAVLVDAYDPVRLGGTGLRFDWERAADSLSALRDSRPLVLAGGLTAGSVAAAIAALHPDVVDVSSGVESAPGVKDHVRVADFVRAVQEAERELD
ncbi:MAG: N-(5'-phosphoribosyl)anthranilate isomerase [Gemmatimonadaceae bacterium]|nr:N-(5'-phosphoribosyl)anthranilate isomerase [Gemmatimonadaceae bacterium]